MLNNILANLGKQETSGCNSQNQDRISNQTNKQESENSESFQYNDLETKASSLISNSSHETSFDFSESSFQNQLYRPEDFLREEFVLERKVTKTQLCLRQDCFTLQYQTHIQQQLIKLCQNPNGLGFHNFLQNIINPNIIIFKNKQSNNLPNEGRIQSVKEVLRNLVLERKNDFFIYTFDLSICHLSFMIILLGYWVRPMNALIKNYNSNYTVHMSNPTRFQQIIKQNILFIVRNYVYLHSQQINENQALLIVVILFLDTLKSNIQSQSEAIMQTQNLLYKDIKTLRNIQKNQRSFSKLNNKLIFESKLKKFQDNHFFISFPDSTFHLIKSHILQNFSSLSLQKIYQFDSYSDSRRQYQMKKDAFCLWVLQNILKQGQNKSFFILHNSANYIVQIMSMLKKLKGQNNIEGISYLLPIIANLKAFLPKVWRHVIKRRPQIETKFNQYSETLLQNNFKIQQLGQQAIIWTETWYTMAQKVRKFMSNRKDVDLQQHQKYYRQCLSHIIFYRNKAKQFINQAKFQVILQNQSTSQFSLSLVENYLVSKYEQVGWAEKWKNLAEKAQKINLNISQSLASDIFDFCFIGSTQKYKKVDI